MTAYDREPDPASATRRPIDRALEGDDREETLERIEALYLDLRGYGVRAVETAIGQPIAVNRSSLPEDLRRHFSEAAEQRALWCAASVILTLLESEGIDPNEFGRGVWREAPAGEAAR